jgi:hypothetical protein
LCFDKREGMMRDAWHLCDTMLEQMFQPVVADLILALRFVFISSVLFAC